MMNFSIGTMQIRQPHYSFRIRSAASNSQQQHRWWLRLIGVAAMLGFAGAAWADTIDYKVTSDSRIDSYYTSRNYGNSDDLKLIVNSSDHNSGSFVRVLVDIPDSALAAAQTAVASGNLTSVKLYMDFWWMNIASGETAASRSIVAHPLTQSWVEGTGDNYASGDGVTFLTYDGTHSWATAGGDYNSSVSISWTPTSGVDSSTNVGWWYFDLTSLIKSGYDLSDGLILMLSPETACTASSTWCTYCAYGSESGGVNSPYVEVSSVPEPGTLALLFSTGFAATFLFFRRRWRRPAEPMTLSNAA